MDIHQETEDLIEITSKIGKSRPWLPHIEGIPSGEIIMLHHIKYLQKETALSGSGVKISVLSSRAGISMPAVSQMMRSMEGKGLVQRCMACEDRRVVYVSLTARGEEVESKAWEYTTHVLEKVVQELGEKNAQQLIVLFHKLYEVLQSIDSGSTESR